MEQVNKEAKNQGLDFVFTLEDAEEAIAAYFARFKTLKKWIDNSKSAIQKNGYIYSHFGRKRRLANAFSSDPATKSHAIRSGVNFAVQSPSSDVNLLGAIEMWQYIIKNGMKSKIFALVHDSIVAEVPEEELENYKEKLKFFIQKDRGLTIPGFPIGCDFEIGDDYSFGGFEKQYGIL